MRKTDTPVVWLVNQILRLASKDYRDRLSTVIADGFEHQSEDPFNPEFFIDKRCKNAKDNGSCDMMHDEWGRHIACRCDATALHSALLTLDANGLLPPCDKTLVGDGSCYVCNALEGVS